MFAAGSSDYYLQRPTRGAATGRREATFHLWNSARRRIRRRLQNDWWAECHPTPTAHAPTRPPPNPTPSNITLGHRTLIEFGDGGPERSSTISGTSPAGSWAWVVALVRVPDTPKPRSIVGRNDSLQIADSIHTVGSAKQLYALPNTPPPVCGPI